MNRLEIKNPVVAGSLLLAVSLLVGFYPIWARPDIVQGKAFLFRDEGMTLLLGDMLNHGKQLYQDIYSSYAPISIQMWAVIARLFGNTPVVFGVSQVALNALVLMLLWAAFKRRMSPAWAMLVTVICVLPAVMVRGQMLGGYWSNTYIALERVFIALLLWGWRPPHERSTKRSAALGAVIGGIHWIKFGSIAFVALGFLAADVVAMVQTTERRNAIRQLGIVIASSVGVVIVFAAWAFATLSRPIAWDVIWPAFGIRQYEKVEATLRYPPVAPQLYFFRRDAAAFAGLILGVVTLIWKRRSAEAPLVAFMLVAYTVGVLLLFRHVYHYYQYAWILTTLVGFAISAWPGSWRLGSLALCLPVLLFSIKALVSAPEPGEWVKFPHTTPLYLTPDAVEDVRALRAIEDKVTAQGGIVLNTPSMMGWYHAMGHTPPFRHVWFLPGYVRPWEAEVAARAFGHASMLTVCNHMGAGFSDMLDADLAAFVGRTFPNAQPLTPRCSLFTRQ